MKRGITLLACLILLSISVEGLAQGPVTEPTSADHPPALERTTLPNGLRVWFEPRPDSESVSLLLIIGIGSRFENPTNNGISHFVEHLVFTGTERWTEEEIKRIITRRGGYWNGGTGFERTTYWAHVPNQDFDLALDWLAEVVFHPTFPADKIEKERQVILHEVAENFGWLLNAIDALGFGYTLDRDIRRALFPHSSLSMGIIGHDSSLKSFQRADLLDYHQEHYTPNNAVLIVVGNVTREQVDERVSETLGDLEPGIKPISPETPALPAEGPHQIVVRGPNLADQVALRVGARTVGRTHPDIWALYVLSEMLDATLTEEIRHRRGLVYGLGSYNSTFDDAGYFVIWTTSARKNRDTILQIVEGNLEAIRQGKVDAERANEAKTSLKGRWALAMDDNYSRARWLSQWPSVLSPDEPLPDYQTSIDRVTPEDLSRVVDTYFTPERSFVGLHLPVVTATSGARAVAILVVLAVMAWGGWRVRRRRRNRKEESANHNQGGTPDEV